MIDLKMIRNDDHFMVHVDEVAPRAVDPERGWKAMDIRFLLPDDVAAQGVCLFRTVFGPGAAHEKHFHPDAAEFLYVVRGRAGVGAGAEEFVAESGSVQVIPAGAVHWLRNLDADEEVEVVGGYLGVRSLEEAGYEFVGHLEPAA